MNTDDCNASAAAAAAATAAPAVAAPRAPPVLRSAYPHIASLEETIYGLCRAAGLSRLPQLRPVSRGGDEDADADDLYAVWTLNPKPQILNPTP
jgi:hypothetical protein